MIGKIKFISFATSGGMKSLYEVGKNGITGIERTIEITGIERTIEQGYDNFIYRIYMDEKVYADVYHVDEVVYFME